MNGLPQVLPLEGDLGRDQILIFIEIGVRSEHDLSTYTSRESLCSEARGVTAGQCLSLRADVLW